MLDVESAMLANNDDSHSAKVFDPSIKGDTDRFGDIHRSYRGRRLSFLPLRRKAVSSPGAQGSNATEQFSDWLARVRLERQYSPVRRNLCTASVSKLDSAATRRGDVALSNEGARYLILLFCGPLALMPFFNGVIFVANAGLNNLGPHLFRDDQLGTAYARHSAFRGDRTSMVERAQRTDGPGDSGVVFM